MVIKYPVSDTTISQPFGKDTKTNPISSKFYEAFDCKHCGVDFPVPVGTEIVSSFSGVVVRNENHAGMGNVAGIRDGNIVALYAHLNRSFVVLGKDVDEGTPIGLSGCTGKACPTPHLHFELRDITKKSLKEMVFDPPFEQEVTDFKNTFEYKVNNKNIRKTLKILSKMYFGVEGKWELIKETNQFEFDGDHLLKDGLLVTIPNYH